MNRLKLDDIVRRIDSKENNFRFYYHYYDKLDDGTAMYVTMYEKKINLSKHYQKNYDDDILDELVLNIIKKKNNTLFLNSDIDDKSISDKKQIIERIIQQFHIIEYDTRDYNNMNSNRIVIIGPDNYDLLEMLTEKMVRVYSHSNLGSKIIVYINNPIDPNNVYYSTAFIGMFVSYNTYSLEYIGNYSEYYDIFDITSQKILREKKLKRILK